MLYTGSSSSSLSSRSPSERLRRSVTPGDRRSPQLRQRYSLGILLDIVEPDVARVARRSSPAGHWLSACLHRNPPSEAEHHMLLLLRPDMQHGQTEISVDNVTNGLQNRSLKHFCIGEMNSQCISSICG